MKEPTVTVAARVPLSQWQALHEGADLEKVSVSVIVARLIAAYNSRQARKAAK